MKVQPAYSDLELPVLLRFIFSFHALFAVLLALAFLDCALFRTCGSCQYSAEALIEAHV